MPTRAGGHYYFRSGAASNRMPVSRPQVGSVVRHCQLFKAANLLSIRVDFAAGYAGILVVYGTQHAQAIYYYTHVVVYSVKATASEYIYTTLDSS